MLKVRVLVPAVALALLVSGCGKPGGSSQSDNSTAAAADASSGTIGPGNGTGITPDILLGKWRGTGDAGSCPQTEFAFTRDIEVAVSNGVGYKYAVTGYAMQSNLKMVTVTSNHIDDFWIIDQNNIQLQTPMTLCPYVRE